MSFDNILYEGVIYTPKLQKLKKSLNNELLQLQTIQRIKLEIEENWHSSKHVSSRTLNRIISSATKSIYNIDCIFVYNVDASAQFNFDAKGEHVITINYDRIAKTSDFYEILSETGTVKKIKDYIIRVINIVVHELVHYYQADSRIEKLNPDDMFYKKARSDKHFKPEDWQYYYMNDKDEMMAYAAEIIGDLKDKGYKQKDILNLISQDKEIINNELDDYRRYNKKIKLSNWNTFLSYLYKYATDYYREM